MSRSGLLPVGVLVWIGYIICLYVYRITFHPLAKYPGPKLAAISRWYEFYYDVILKGQYVFHLQELHEQYGPIIRVSPEELHINDPEFFEVLYTKSGRLHKRASDSNRFGNPNSIFTTPDGNVHRIRRAALNPFFSRRKTLAFQPFVRDRIEVMINGIKNFQATGKPLSIMFAYMALTGDLIMEYCYGYNFHHVESPGFETNFHELLLTGSQSGNLVAHFPIVMKIIMSLPEWFVVWSTPLFALLFKLNKSVEKDVIKNKRREDSGEAKLDLKEPNVIQHLLRSDLPAHEKSVKRISDEAQNFVGAGVSTTGWAMSVATYHIIKNRPIFQKLRKELEQAIPNPDSSDALNMNKLELCEYITACIKEGIRLSYALSGRLTRVGDNVIQYGNWHIPPNTPISMTLVDLNHDEDIFTDSTKFKPERWLGDARTAKGEPIDKYWFGFMRGSRSCIGINLAWMEMYMTLAAVFRSFDFELFETDDSDVVLKHDFMIPVPKLDSKGIKVLVT